MIQVSHLTKYYGDFLAVNDLSFEIQDGHVYGFLGPNGAGKTTTMNIMTGCLFPTDGTVKIGGFDLLEQPEATKKLIGYLPEQPPLYPNETPQEYLTFVGEAKGLRGKELREEIDSAVQSAGIENVRDRLIGTLSKGYRQRVGIAQALLGKPQVIILDEPTVGLDPIQIIEIRDFIKELGKTHMVILSSHTVTSIDVTLEGEDYIFTYNPPEDEDDADVEGTWTYQDTEFDIFDFSYALRALSATSFTDEAPTGQGEISLTLHLDNEEFPTFTLTLYRLDGESCIACVDGESVAFVSRDKAVDLIEAVRAVTLGA